MTLFCGRTDNPYYDADRYFDMCQEQFKNRPICDCCKEHITSEYGYRINNELLCEDCFRDYITEIRENMENYDYEEED